MGDNLKIVISGAMKLEIQPGKWETRLFFGSEPPREYLDLWLGATVDERKLIKEEERETPRGIKIFEEVRKYAHNWSWQIKMGYPSRSIMRGAFSNATHGTIGKIYGIKHWEKEHYPETVPEDVLSALDAMRVI